MRIAKSDDEIKFRVPAELKRRAQSKARSQLSTLSAVLRWLLAAWVEGNFCEGCGALLPSGASPYHIAPDQPGIFLCEACAGLESER